MADVDNVENASKGLIFGAADGAMVKLVLRGTIGVSMAASGVARGAGRSSWCQHGPSSESRTNGFPQRRWPHAVRDWRCGVAVRAAERNSGRLPSAGISSEEACQASSSSFMQHPAVVLREPSVYCSSCSSRCASHLSTTL